MKKLLLSRNVKFLGIFIAVILLNILLPSRRNGLATVNGDGGVGAPGDGTTCIACHSSNGTYNTSISFNIYEENTTTPITAYTAGSTYDILFVTTANGGTPAGYGFQLLALENAGNTNAGSWSSWSSNVKQASTGSGASLRYYIEHGVGNTYSIPGSYTVKWTAPVAGTGDVTFYYGGNSVNGNNNTSGDDAALGSTIISENLCPSNLTLVSPSDNITDTSIEIPAASTIYASNVVGFTTTHTVLYNAGEAIYLLPEFYANAASASEFRAAIEGGCINLLAKTDNNLQSIEILPNTETIVFPNPTGNYAAHILLKSTTENAHFTINLFDISGRFLQNIFDGNTSQQEIYPIEFSTQNLPSGTYIIRIKENENAPQNIRFVVM
ncbi:MAG: choice-of-anchor V domain-containing protein [Chitinophagales bacterium]|nr:T9SS type A sorting domain-containing protein [Bacteroidota bacterium]MCB9043125.1 T9SS type A sorting domain-containing protein [Chitinophagales bacterium]